MLRDDELWWCSASCGNNVHAGCFDAWARESRWVITCPICQFEPRRAAPEAAFESVSGRRRGRGGGRKFDAGAPALAAEAEAGAGGGAVDDDHVTARDVILAVMGAKGGVCGSWL